MVLIFNSGEFTNVDINNFLGVVPPSWVAASLDISIEDARGINYNLPGFAPAQRPAPVFGTTRQQQSQPAARRPVAQL